MGTDTTQRAEQAPTKCRSPYCQNDGDPEPSKNFRDLEGYCGPCRSSITDTRGT